MNKKLLQLGVGVSAMFLLAACSSSEDTSQEVEESSVETVDSGSHMETLIGSESGSGLEMDDQDEADRVDTKDVVSAFSDSVTNANETIARNNHAIESIDNYKEMASAYRDMQAERIALYEATGDVSKLSMPDDEFSQLKESHNELVEQLWLPLGLMIEFNGYDHVNQKLDAMGERVKQVKAEMIAENVGDMESAFSTYSDVWDKAREKVNSIGDTPGTDRGTSRRLSKMTPDELSEYKDSLNIPAEDWDVMIQGAEDYARAMKEIDKAFGGEEYSNAHKELKSMDKEFDKLGRYRNK